MASVLFAVIFTLLNAVCTFANSTTIDGHLDSIEGNAIAGWLWDSADPESSHTITVTITNKSTGEIAASAEAEANEYREDLLTLGLGTGNYGFHAEIDWSALPDAIYSVSLSADDFTLSQTLTQAIGETYVHGNLVSLGTFKTTAYCPCRQCSEGWGRMTSSGALATANFTVAVDKRVIPIGSHLLINGQEYVAQDIGGGVKGKHIDIYFNTHGETTEHGVQNAEVYLIV